MDDWIKNFCLFFYSFIFMRLPLFDLSHSQIVCWIDCRTNIDIAGIKSRFFCLGFDKRPLPFIGLVVHKSCGSSSYFQPQCEIPWFFIRYRKILVNNFDLSTEFSVWNGVDLDLTRKMLVFVYWVFKTLTWVLSKLRSFEIIVY